MAKIEELSELLVQELDQFSSDLKKLEVLNQEGVKIDDSGITRRLEEHQGIVEQSQKNLQQQIERLEQILKKSNIYPRWAVIIFLVSLLFNFLLLLILFFRYF